MRWQVSSASLQEPDDRAISLLRGMIFEGEHEANGESTGVQRIGAADLRQMLSTWLSVLLPGNGQEI
jgi:hypothetical protein